jgi:antitoxin component YwqK of YwqJK toxin-antitoxin module
MLVLPFHMNGQANASDSKVADTINKTDANGDKTGFWIEKSNDITFKGEYVANKKVKNWIGLYSNNVVARIDYYTNGLKDGIAVQVDRKNKITLVENFKHGLLHGQVISYSQFTESPVTEAEYANGKKTGLYRQYYDNGKIQEETWFKDDLKAGLSRWNNKNGQRLAEYNYKANNFDGLQKTFYENDSIQTINHFKDNVLSGEIREYYRNGKLKLTGNYLNGLKDGTFTEYNELGKVEKVTRFKNGEETVKK